MREALIVSVESGFLRADCFRSTVSPSCLKKFLNEGESDVLDYLCSQQRRFEPSNSPLQSDV